MITTRGKRFDSRKLLQVAFFAVALLFLSGCGDGSPKLTTAETNAFATAPAEVKQLWEKALAADKSNDYVTAQAAFDSLARLQIREEQKTVFEKARASFGQRVWTAAEKNDPVAIKVIQDSKSSRNQSSGRATQ